MKRTVCSLTALLALAAPLFAIYDWQPLQENNFYMTITNYGQLGQTEGGNNAGCFWPAPAIDSNGNLVPPLMNYIYGWGLWIGAQVPNDSLPGKIDTLVTMGYNPANGNYEYTPGAVIDGVPQNRYDPTVKIYLSDEPDWPLKKTDGQDSILSLLDTRCVYNDWYSPQHQAGGRPLKVEVTQATYLWDTADLEDIIFFLWEVKNTGNDTLLDVYLAPVTDCDIGNESGSNANDICWYDSTTELAYQYQNDSTEAGWPRNAGCVGFSFLQGPVATKDFTFPDGHQIIAGDTLGLTVFKVFNINIDPQNDIDQYKELAGYDYQTGDFCRLDPSPAPGDQRFMESAGPIDIPPGGTAKTIVSVICANLDYSFLPGAPLSAIDALRQKVIDSKLVFSGVAGGPDMPAVGGFSLAQNMPNPFYQHTNINYQISKPGQVSLKVYNIAGQLVRTVVDARQPAGSYSVRWDGRDQAGHSVAAGIYLYQLKAGDRALTRKMVLIR